MPLPIDPARIIEAARESMFGTEDIGFCIKCGEERPYTEPDARHYPCESCCSLEVYGASELIIMGYAG